MDRIILRQLIDHLRMLLNDMAGEGNILSHDRVRGSILFFLEILEVLVVIFHHEANVLPVKVIPGKRLQLLHLRLIL